MKFESNEYKSKLIETIVRVSWAPIIICYVFSRCCLSSWNGLCCEFPLDHKEEEPEDAAHYSNYFSIQAATLKPWQNQNGHQFFYKNLFDGYLDRTRVQRLQIPKNHGKPYQWWAESKWVKNTPSIINIVFQCSNINTSMDNVRVI